MCFATSGPSNVYISFMYPKKRIAIRKMTVRTLPAEVVLKNVERKNWKQRNEMMNNIVRMRRRM